MKKILISLLCLGISSMAGFSAEDISVYKISNNQDFEGDNSVYVAEQETNPQAKYQYQPTDRKTIELYSINSGPVNKYHTVKPKKTNKNIKKTNTNINTKNQTINNKNKKNTTVQKNVNKSQSSSVKNINNKNNVQNKSTNIKNFDNKNNVKPVSKNVQSQQSIKTNNKTNTNIKPAVQKNHQQDTIFSPDYVQKKRVAPDESKNMVLKKFVMTKELKQKYKEVTKNEKLIEACELLKTGSGKYSYRSVFGKNKTKLPISIEFSNFSKNPVHECDDAYGAFYGNKYKLFINSKFQDSPAAAIAPVIAREALVKKKKNERVSEVLKQLQIAVWEQMLRKYPYLEASQNKLVKMQLALQENGDFEEYKSFLAKAESSDEGTVSSKNGKKFSNGQATQENFDYEAQEKSERISEEIISYDSKTLEKKYKKVTKEPRIMEALSLLSDSIGKFSHDAILGKNITNKPITVKFKNLAEINPKYATFDALGWRQAGKLNIYINSKHEDAPAAALAAILSHEALHQDEYDSLNEETYAWTMEASVWAQMCDKYPEVSEIANSLVTRENLLKKLLEKGNYTNKYIKKSVFSNPSYSNLPVRSPGFEDDF